MHSQFTLQNMKRLNFLLISLFIIIPLRANVQITHAQGWLETVYAEWNPMTNYADYAVYIKPAGGSYNIVDQPLVRSYGSYWRVDVPGLTAGQYQLKVLPLDSAGREIQAEAAETNMLTVAPHDRNGYAHFQYQTGVGAYQNNGTLKTGAKVLYITKNTASTVSTNVTGADKNPCVGIQSIIDAYQKGKETTPICFRIIGTIQRSDLDHISSSAEGLQIKGRNADSELQITIEGIGNDATFKGFGILVRNAASVEIRNLGVMTGLDDGISLDTDNDHIWVHHIDVFYGPNKGGDQAKGDGGIDIKGNSKHVTISYCHFWDTGKSSMCGMTSESGPNYITYHHNWFDHSDSRHARIRTMTVHMYNNFFDGIAKYGVGSTMGSSVFVEANYFKNCPHPMLISKQGTDIHDGVGTSDQTKGTFSGEDGGIIKSFGNQFIGSYTCEPYSATRTQHFDRYEATSRNEEVPASVVSLLGSHTYNNFDTDPTRIYTYTPDLVDSVPSIVTGQKGAGRCQHGDFQFTFTDADNADYEVNTALRNLIDTYTSSLLYVSGESNSNPGGNDTIPTTPGDSTITSGDYLCIFEGGQPSSNFYTISGNYSSSKGTFTYQGVTYKWCLKLESSTSVSFTTSEEMTLILGFDKAAANIKIDGTKQVATNGIIQYTLPAGSHQLTKADSNNLYYINLIPTSSQTDLPDISSSSTDNTAVRKLFINGQLYLLHPSGAIYTLSGLRLR